MLVLCLNYATIQGGTPPPFFTLSSLDQLGHLKSRTFQVFKAVLIWLPVCHFVSFPFTSVWERLGPTSPSENFCLLLTTTSVMLTNYLIQLYSMLNEDKAHLEKFIEVNGSHKVTLYVVLIEHFIEYKGSWEGPGKFFLLRLINPVLPWPRPWPQCTEISNHIKITFFQYSVYFPKSNMSYCSGVSFQNTNLTLNSFLEQNKSLQQAGWPRRFPIK